MLHYVLSRPRLAPAQRGLSYSQAIAPIVLLPRSGLVQYMFCDTEHILRHEIQYLPVGVTSAQGQTAT
jgi:hypothetical protein